MTLAVVQAAFHLYCDYDRLTIPVTKRTPGSKDKRTHVVDPVLKRINGALVHCAVDALKKAAAVTAASPFIYVLFLRRPAWNFSLFFAKLFWNFSRTAAEPQNKMPPEFYNLFYRQIISGVGLVFLWQTANLFFTVFITQEPLKRGQPLTTDAKDPTGSLTNGLKAKKEFVKSYAFWELCFISQQFSDRRKAIFGDIDREGGSAWKQVLEACIEHVSSVTGRINSYKNPPSTITAVPPPSKEANVSYPQLQTLPHLTEAPKQENIFASSPKANGFGDTFGATAKSYGHSPDWTPAATAKAREALGQASNMLLSPERKKALLFLGGSEEQKLLPAPPPAARSQFNISSIPFVAQFLRSPIGKPFRQTYAQRLCSIVFGTPYGQLSSIVDAIESMAQLLIASLTEDSLGQVQKDIPRVINLFTSTITTLESFISDADGLDIHWSDVTFPPPNKPEAQTKARRDVVDVDIVLSALKSSLAELLAAFERYQREVGLQSKDIRLAKAAVGLQEEDGNE
jgi:nucleoporin NDC1